jgi:hypothetical protein
MLRPHDTLAALPESLASVWKLDEDQGRAEDCWTAQTLCRDGITRQKRGAGIMSDSEAVDSTERRRSLLSAAGAWLLEADSHDFGVGVLLCGGGRPRPACCTPGRRRVNFWDRWGRETRRLLAARAQVTRMRSCS